MYTDKPSAAKPQRRTAVVCEAPTAAHGTGVEIGVIEAGYRCNVLRLDPSDTAAVRPVGDSLESCYCCVILEDSSTN